MSPKGHAFGSLDPRPYETPSRACRDDPPALPFPRAAQHQRRRLQVSRLSISRSDSEVRITRNADIDRARNLITMLPLARPLGIALREQIRPHLSGSPRMHAAEAGRGEWQDDAQSQKNRGSRRPNHLKEMAPGSIAAKMAAALSPAASCESPAASSPPVCFAGSCCRPAKSVSRITGFA